MLLLRRTGFQRCRGRALRTSQGNDRRCVHRCVIWILSTIRKGHASRLILHGSSAWGHHHRHVIRLRLWVRSLLKTHMGRLRLKMMGLLLKMMHRRRQSPHGGGRCPSHRGRRQLLQYRTDPIPVRANGDQVAPIQRLRQQQRRGFRRLPLSPPKLRANVPHLRKIGNHSHGAHELRGTVGGHLGMFGREHVAEVLVTGEVLEREIEGYLVSEAVEEGSIVLVVFFFCGGGSLLLLELQFA
mmetsp:Transcript_31875/g.60964  ORF Transcript_31875/g.60964 Transcript_31875/m.60964 type:complete len:241 (+) Transcript_31875:802-1524(+)